MTAQEKVWKVIRGLHEFTTEDVVVLTELPRSTVSVYLSTLHKAGYLRITNKKGHQSVFRMIKNTGPKPPVQRRCLYDQNTKQMMFIEIKEGSKCLKSFNRKSKKKA